MRCAKKSDLKCDVCSVTDRLFSRFLFEPLFFAIFANVAFFCDVCSDRFFFRDVRSSRFFLRLLFESLFFFAIFVHVSCKLLFKSLFFCDFRPGRFFAIFAHVPFFADAFQTHFSRISFEKVRQRQSPNAFLQVANRIFEHNFFYCAIAKKRFCRASLFFWRFLFPSHFCAFFLVGARVKRNFVAFLSMRPRVNRIFPSFGISLSCWSRVSMHVAPFVACRPRAVVQKAMLLQRTLQNVFFHKQVHGLKERCRDIHTSCVRLYSEALMQALFQHIQIDALDKWRKGK